MKTKTCACCGKSKSRGEFYDHQHTRDRLQPYCMTCYAIKNRTRYYQKKAAGTLVRKKREPPRWQKWSAIARRAAGPEL